MNGPNQEATCERVRTVGDYIYFALSDGTFWKISTRDFGKPNGKWEQLTAKPKELEK